MIFGFGGGITGVTLGTQQINIIAHNTLRIPGHFHVTVVGGTTLLGGSGGVWNTVAGVLIVNVISNGMVVAGLPRYLQDGVLGLLVIIAVVLSTDRKSISFVK